MELGSILGERYQIISVIGKGGMSEVFLAKDLVLGKQWAVKCLDSQTKEEAYFLSHLEHPALPKVVDFIWNGQVGYLVMEYIHGMTIKEYVQKNKGLEIHEWMNYAKQLCDVMQYLHRQNPPIIYRDMKPANIIRSQDGVLRLVDFGIAREYKEEASMDTVCLGTQGYAAPEQFGDGQSDARTDIYALGRTLHFMLGARAVPDSLERILDRCCEVNPKQRYSSVKELLAALRRWNYNRRFGLMKKGIIIFSISTVLLWGMATYQYTKGNRQVSEQYQQYLQRNSSALIYEENLYKAIALCPDRITAYENLANYYASVEFTSQRQKRYMDRVLESEQLIRRKSGYGDLCFSIGCLYAFRQGTKDWAVNMKVAYPWFEKARKYADKQFQFRKDVLEALCLISHFFERVNYNISKDAISQKDYRELFTHMEEGTRLLKGNEKNDTMKELSKLIENCLYMFENQWHGYVSEARIQKIIEQLICTQREKDRMSEHWKEKRVKYDEV